MSLPFLLLLGGTSGAVTVTQTQAEIFATGDPSAIATQTSVEAFGLSTPSAFGTQTYAEVFGSPPPSAIETQIYAEIFGEVRQAVFTNADIFIGIVWMELTTRSGVQYVWSDRRLPDPSSYYLGNKEPRVIEWQRIRRAFSGMNGEYETSDFGVTLSDTDRLLRELDKENELVNATVIVRMITDPGRRRLERPRVIYRGMVRHAAPKGTLEYILTIKDPFAEQFSLSTQSSLLPHRTVTRTDFPNCTVDKIRSSAEGYTTNGTGAIGVGTINVHAGVGQFAPGDIFRFSGHTTVYTASDGSGTDPETSLTFTPNLTNAVIVGETITQDPSHSVPTSMGFRVPIVYGYITDRKIISGEDAGDGQGPVLYVGDRVLSDGKTYAEFLWAGHACYSPSDRPFTMLYFFNNALDDMAVGTFYHNALILHVANLATEAGAGGRAAVPGYGNWTALGFTTPYVDYGGRRYTVFFLRGLLRDWALGVMPAPFALGGIPMCVNAYGVETHGDGSGALISNGLLQYQHAVVNWFPPIGNGYQSGAWLTAPVFPDGTSMIEENSFLVANAQSKVYVNPLGFRGDFIIGAGNETVTARELIARFNVSFGVNAGFNLNTQFFIRLVNTNLATTALANPLGYVRDIFAGTFEIEPLDRELYTALDYRHTQDYLKRAPDGWRSSLGGVVEVENSGATSTFGSKTTFSQFKMFMIRGKNRAEDADEYVAGTDTANAVLALALARYSAIQHLPKLQTGPAGYNYELGDVALISHYEGLSSIGWTDAPCRLERTEYDPSQFTAFLEWYYLPPVLV